MNRQRKLKATERMLSSVESYRRQYFEMFGRWPKKPDNLETMAQAGKYIGDIREALGKDRSGSSRQQASDEFFKKIRHARDEFSKNTKRHVITSRIFVGLQDGLTEFKRIDLKNAKNFKTSVKDMVFFHRVNPLGSFATCDYALSVTFEEALSGLGEYLYRQHAEALGSERVTLMHLLGRVDSELSNVRGCPRRKKHNLNKRLFVGIGSEGVVELVWSSFKAPMSSTERVQMHNKISRSKAVATCDFGADMTSEEVLLIMKDYLRKLHVLRQAYISPSGMNTDPACFYIRKMVSKVTDTYREMKDHTEKEAEAPTLDESGSDEEAAKNLDEFLNMLIPEGLPPHCDGQTAIGRLDEVFQRKCKGKAHKILFGGAPGGGKTNAVLQMAHMDYGKLENEFFMALAKKFLNEFEVSLPVDGLPYTAYPRVYDPKQIAKWFKENLG